MKKILTVITIVLGIWIFNLSYVECSSPNIVEKFLPWSENREILTREYAELHYDMSITNIEPQAVVIHWTAGNTWQSAYNIFYDEISNDPLDEGAVNVSSQFIVDRDGTIYQLMPDNKLARHAIGYNWCAIGIENVGGVNGVENLTYEQLKANIELIRYLRNKYLAIKYIFGHYQQDIARESGLYIEHVQEYSSVKPDPGPIFMKAIQDNLQNEGFIFFSIDVN